METSRLEQEILQSPRIFRFGDFVLHMERFELRKGGMTVHLQPKTFDVLCYLVSHPARLIDKDELLRAVWPEEQPETWDDANALGIAVGATAGYSATMAGASYAAVSDSVHAMSASADLQSRNLLASRHANASAMRAAGMKVKSRLPGSGGMSSGRKRPRGCWMCTTMPHSKEFPA